MAPKVLLILGDQTDIEEPIQQDEIISLFPIQDTVEVLDCRTTVITREIVLGTISDRAFDIIIIVGHSRANDNGVDGQISINQIDKISIQDFQQPFIRSVNNGLKLVILAGCSSIGAARALAGERINVPNVISFRVPVHYQVVRQVFNRLFHYWIEDSQSLEAALTNTRQELTIQNPVCPGASILPILFTLTYASPLSSEFLKPPKIDPLPVVKLPWHKKLLSKLNSIPQLLKLSIFFVFGFLLVWIIYLIHFSQPTSQDICKVANSINRISCGEEIILMPDSRPPTDNKQRGFEAIKNNDYTRGIEFLQQDWDERKDPETLLALNNAKLVKNKITNIKTIAVVVSRTRTPYFVATQILKGIAQAQDECNKIDRAWKLRVIIADDGNNFREAKEIANQLVKHQEILLVIGHYSSNVTVRIKNIYQQAKTVLLSATSTSDDLSNFGSNNFFFRVVSSNIISAKDIAQKWVSKYEKIVIFDNPNGDFSISLKKGLLSQIRPDSIISISDRPDKFNLTKQNNPNEEIAIARAAGAKAIILLPDAYTNDIERERVLSIINANNGQLPILANSIVNDPYLSQVNPLWLQNLVISIPVHPSNRQYIDENRLSQAPKWWGDKTHLHERIIDSYDAMQVSLSVLDLASNREEVQKEISSPNFSAQGITGRITFNGSDRAENINSLVTPTECNQNGCKFKPYQ